LKKFLFIFLSLILAQRSSGYVSYLYPENYENYYCLCYFWFSHG
jgi:hypothetical protein